MGSSILSSAQHKLPNMRLLIVLSACVALSSAKHFPGGFKYTGPLNMETRLVDHPNGAKVPADEPAVASARAAHLSSKAAIAASAPVGAAAPFAAAPFAAAPFKYTGPLNMETRLVDHPNGAKVPVDEPAVATARAAHLSS